MKSPRLSCTILVIVISLFILLHTQLAFPSLLKSNRYENTNLEKFPSHTYSVLIDYLIHDPINISSDSDFAATKELEEWTGNGSVDNPYIIEGFNITYNGFSIRISNVTSYFVIRNCYLASTGVVEHDPYDNGVVFYNVTRGTITNNIIANNTDGGIYLGDSKGFIDNNRLIGNRLGIILDNSSASVTRNQITGTNDVSILILDSFVSDISNNYASTIWGESILFDNVTGCRVTGNTFENHSATFRSCRNCTIDANRFLEGSGISLDSSSEMTVSLNSILQPSWTGIEVFRCNSTIVSYNSISGANGNGILAYKSDMCRYYGNRIWGGLMGIEIAEVRYSNFTFNHIQSQQYYGIGVTQGSENILYGNLMTIDGYGPAADWGANNQWDDGVLMGNFWEGIEEGSLEIYGTAESIDRFARTISDEDFYFPHIRSEPIVSILDGIRASLTWIVYCSPFDYVIYANDTPIEGGCCLDTNAVTIDISDLPPGHYSFILRVYPLYIFLDPFGYIASPPFNATMPDVLFIDSDSDSMPDSWELEHGLNPHADDAGEDADEDDLLNLDEYLIGTDPNNPDSDFDMIFDGWEIRYGLNPLNATDAALDFDSDSLTNLQEFELGTDPTKSDSDSDTFLDGWEVRHGFDPNDPAVSLAEYLTFHSPLIGGVSICVIALIGGFYIRHRRELTSCEKVQEKEKEDEKTAIEELLE